MRDAPATLTPAALFALLGNTATIAIGALDAMADDPDLENATGLEDAFEQHHPDGPGCPVADAGEDVGDEQDGDFAEDECAARFERIKSGPGCPIADPDLEHDGREQEDGI